MNVTALCMDIQQLLLLSLLDGSLASQPTCVEVGWLVRLVGWLQPRGILGVQHAKLQQK